MSKIKNGVRPVRQSVGPYSLDGIGGERVNPLFYLSVYLHRVSKNCAKLFLSELCQLSTNFDNFWQKDGKEAKIM